MHSSSYHSRLVPACAPCSVRVHHRHTRRANGVFDVHNSAFIHELRHLEKDLFYVDRDLPRKRVKTSTAGANVEGFCKASRLCCSATLSAISQALNESNLPNTTNTVNSKKSVGQIAERAIGTSGFKGGSSLPKLCAKPDTGSPEDNELPEDVQAKKLQDNLNSVDEVGLDANASKKEDGHKDVSGNTTQSYYCTIQMQQATKNALKSLLKSMKDLHLLRQTGPISDQAAIDEKLRSLLDIYTEMQRKYRTCCAQRLLNGRKFRGENSQVLEIHRIH